MLETESYLQIKTNIKVLLKWTKLPRCLIYTFGFSLRNIVSIPIERENGMTSDVMSGEPIYVQAFIIVSVENYIIRFLL